MPAVARKRTEAGGRAFVRYWIQTANYAAATGDVKLLAKVSADGCAGCDGIITGIKSIYDDGGRVVAGGWEPPLLRTYPSQRGDQAFAGRVTYGAHEALETVRSIDAGKFVGVFHVNWVGVSWEMAWISSSSASNAPSGVAAGLSGAGGSIPDTPVDCGQDKGCWAEQICLGNDEAVAEYEALTPDFVVPGAVLCRKGEPGLRP